MTIRKTIIAFTALAALVPAASARNLGLGAAGEANIIMNENQINWADQASLINIWGGWVGGDLRGASTAIGNNIESLTTGSTYFYNIQRNLNSQSAEIHVTLNKGVGGDVDLKSVAVCNNASFTSKDGPINGFSDQRCGTNDPTAFTNVNLAMVLGNTSLAATAISNNLSVGSNGGAVQLEAAYQVNDTDDFARVDAQIGSTAGDVVANATAVGNNISVTSVP